MAANRTGTSTWKKTATLALHLAKARGQWHCPYCNVILDYENRRASNGAQVDHIRADANGGNAEQQNLQICCARCNQSKGNRTAPKRATAIARTPLITPLITSRKW